MIAGELPAMQAYTSGKLKIEGDIMKSQLIEACSNLLDPVILSSPLPRGKGSG